MYCGRSHPLRLSLSHASSQTARSTRATPSRLWPTRASWPWTCSSLSRAAPSATPTPAALWRRRRQRAARRRRRRWQRRREGAWLLANAPRHLCCCCTLFHAPPVNSTHRFNHSQAPGDAKQRCALVPGRRRLRPTRPVCCAPPQTARHQTPRTTSRAACVTARAGGGAGSDKRAAGRRLAAAGPPPLEGACRE